MKFPLLLSLMLALASVAYAQTAPTEQPGKSVKYKSDGKLPVDPDTQLVTYSGVVEVPGATQAQLYARAAAWVAGNSAYYVASSKQLQEAADKSQFTVKGETPARAGLGGQTIGTVSHKLTLYFKDGRYKYVLTDFREEANQPKVGSGGAFENEKPACGAMLMFTGVWNTIKRHTDEDVHDLLARLQLGLRNTSKSPTDF